MFERVTNAIEKPKNIINSSYNSQFTTSLAKSSLGRYKLSKTRTIGAECEREDTLRWFS